MAESMATMTAAISIDLHRSKTLIAHRFGNPAPALEGFSRAIWAVFWTGFILALDKRELKNDNSHSKLLLDGV
jgi:hypothetical protein